MYMIIATLKFLTWMFMVSWALYWYTCDQNQISQNPDFPKNWTRFSFTGLAISIEKPLAPWLFTKDLGEFGYFY